MSKRYIEDTKMNNEFDDPRIVSLVRGIERVKYEAESAQCLEVVVVLNTLLGALLCGRLVDLTKLCQEFAGEIREELASKRPKRKIRVNEDTTSTR